MLKKHAVLSALAILAGMLAIAWLRPTTSGGAVLVMTLAFVGFNAAGALFKGKVGAPPQTPPG